MSGVVRFARDRPDYEECSGLFWQISYNEFGKIKLYGNFAVGGVKICVAEFLAALTTLETFTDICVSRFTTVKIDNTVAKLWWDSSRCSVSPFDRCAQGVHLHLLKMVIKIRTEWVPSEINRWADRCSRTHFSRRKRGHVISGIRLRKTAPKFRNVMRFL